MVLGGSSELVFTSVTLDFTGPVPALLVMGLSEQGRAPISQGRKSGQGITYSGLPAFELRGRKCCLKYAWKGAWGTNMGISLVISQKSLSERKPNIT